MRGLKNTVPISHIAMRVHRAVLAANEGLGSPVVGGKWRLSITQAGILGVLLGTVAWAALIALLLFLEVL